MATGTVSQITTRYTVLEDVDRHRRSSSPTNIFVSNIVRNLSFPDTCVRVAVTVQVAYQTDLDRAMQIMVEEARVGEWVCCLIRTGRAADRLCRER